MYTCTVKFFDVSIGEADTFVFDNIEQVGDVGQSLNEGLLTVTHNDRLIQIAKEKLISLVIA